MSTQALISGDPIKEKLVGFLAAGVPHTVAAEAVGCDTSYISQLLQIPEFRLAVAEAGAGRLKEAVEHDESIEEVEKKALRMVEARLPYVRSSIEAAKIFATLNSAKRKAVGVNNAPSSGATTVTIVLPKAASATLRLNSSNQVIDVDGRSMATLPSRALPKLAEEVREKHREADSARAASKLETVEALTETKELATMIGGVLRVL